MLTIPQIVGIGVGIVGALGVIAGFLSWLPRRNSKRIDDIKEQTNGKIDCVEGELKTLTTAQGRTEERVKALGKSFVDWKTDVYKPDAAYIKEKLDQIINSGG